MVAALVSSAIVVVATVTVVEWYLEHQHARKWSSLRRIALDDMFEVAHATDLALIALSREVSQVLNAPEGQDEATIARYVPELHGMESGARDQARRARSLAARWGDVMIDAGGADSSLFAHVSALAEVLGLVRISLETAGYCASGMVDPGDAKEMERGMRAELTQAQEDMSSAREQAGHLMRTARPDLDTPF